MEEAESGLALDAGRALDALLEAKNRNAARLSVLERLFTPETDKERRRRGCWSAGTLGAHARAVHMRVRLRPGSSAFLDEEPARDREALDGLVELYEGNRDCRASSSTSCGAESCSRKGPRRARESSVIAGDPAAEALDEYRSGTRRRGPSCTLPNQLWSAS